eukprot:gene25932-31317_t
MDSKGTPERRTVSATHQPGPTFAKAIFLGDVGTGKSSLIQYLNANAAAIQTNIRSNMPMMQDQDFFLPIELKPQEIEHNQPVILKVWEYSATLSKKDEMLAFRGALFTVVVFDITNAASYASVFSKWLPLKEQLAPDSFLIVVGTRFDLSPVRQVALAEVCRECARRDSVYVECSTTRGHNLALLKRILCRRVSFMLQRREELIAHAHGSNATQGVVAGEGESKQSGSAARSEGRRDSRVAAAPAELPLPHLEPPCLTGSTASALASLLNIDTYYNFEKHEDTLRRQRDRLNTLLSEFASLGAAQTQAPDWGHEGGLDLPPDLAALDEVLGKDGLGAGAEGTAAGYSEEDVQASLRDIQEACRILSLPPPKGVTATPSLDASMPLPPLPDDFLSALPARPNLRKLIVRLPGAGEGAGAMADMVIDLEGNLPQQIELFLLSHSLAHDHTAREKLLQCVVRVQKEYIEGAAGSRPRSASSRSTGVGGGAMGMHVGGGAAQFLQGSNNHVE